jgi:sterol desaturase/sphingolipid hydroxylase (fatty acid hydroxylase superfamily)
MAGVRTLFLAVHGSGHYGFAFYGGLLRYRNRRAGRAESARHETALQYGILSLPPGLHAAVPIDVCPDLRPCFTGGSRLGFAEGYSRASWIAGAAAVRIFFAIIWNFWQYALHRLQHAWQVLWETHKFHPSETALNASTQGRHHFLHSMLSSALYLPIFIFFGWLAPHAVFTFILFRLLGLVNHANVRLHLGPLTVIVSNPQRHRIHHSLSPQHHDKNFAAFLSFLSI